MLFYLDTCISFKINNGIFNMIEQLFTMNMTEQHTVIRKYCNILKPMCL